MRDGPGTAQDRHHRDATLIGAYSFETEECFDNATLTFSGSFTITAANGDTLSGAYAGHITGFLDEVTASNVFTATVTGGTGRFAGAAGSLAGTGQANLATFQESRAFSGTISVTMNAVRALFVTLAVLAAIYVARWWTALSRSRSLPSDALERAAAPGLVHTAIGFVTNFFDTLGVGSFATTIYKLRQLVPDERISTGLMPW